MSWVKVIVRYVKYETVVSCCRVYTSDCADSLTETISKLKDRLFFSSVEQISVISAPATLKVQYVRISSQTSPNK